MRRVVKTSSLYSLLSLSVSSAVWTTCRCGSTVEDEPLAHNLRNVAESSPYRVKWFARSSVSPSKRFVYWAFRHVRDIPEEWREYYRSLLYNEIMAASLTTSTWDRFMYIVEGYRKVEWVLHKFHIEYDASTIPSPYRNFWQETTLEERTWAHHRAVQMKEQQAVQRDDGDSMLFGATAMDRRHMSFASVQNAQGGLQGGTPAHAFDLPPPDEDDIEMSEKDEEMSSMFMSCVEDDKLWNPVWISRINREKIEREQAGMLSFEDEPDDDGSDAHKP